MLFIDCTSNKKSLVTDELKAQRLTLQINFYSTMIFFRKLGYRPLNRFIQTRKGLSVITYKKNPLVMSKETIL